MKIRIGSVAICNRGRVGLVTAIRRRGKKTVYEGFNVHEPTRPWQSAVPTVLIERDTLCVIIKKGLDALVEMAEKTKFTKEVMNVVADSSKLGI